CTSRALESMSDPIPSATADPFDAAWSLAAGDGLDEAGRALLARAADWVREPLRGARASTGEPLDAHSAAVVLVLAGLGSDAVTRAAALLAVQPEPEGAVTRQDPMRKAF